jgi:ATP-binding protein involved in chromosome partitioning
MGQIPLLPALREGGDVGLPVTVADPSGEAAECFRRLASGVGERGPGRVFRPELTIR